MIRKIYVHPAKNIEPHLNLMIVTVRGEVNNKESFKHTIYMRVEDEFCLKYTKNKSLGNSVDVNTGYIDDPIPIGPIDDTDGTEP